MRLPRLLSSVENASSSAHGDINFLVLAADDGQLVARGIVLRKLNANRDVFKSLFGLGILHADKDPQHKGDQHGQDLEHSIVGDEFFHCCSPPFFFKKRGRLNFFLGVFGMSSFSNVSRSESM